MNKINWKIRIKNRQFWVNVALAILVPIGGYFGLTGADITTWETLWKVAMDAYSNPFLLSTIAVGLFNAITDPTTVGFRDSERALHYSEPGGE